MQPQAARRKGIGTRVWLIISESGSSYLREVGKHSIMRRTGLPARDLRALDPMLSYPSSILGRERAIVVNLEHIKAIVTAKEVLMLNSTNPLVAQFVEYLKGRILASNVEAPTAREGNNTDMEDVTDTTCTPESVLNRQINTNSYNTETQTSADALAAGDTEKNDNIHKTLKDAPVSTGPKSLPFEFRALEACLESACRCLESETRTLEDEAYPALDELTSKISTLNLERVRQIKSRLVDISGRVQKVRDELEHLLDDDNDMAEMYLTEKLIAQSLELASSRENVDNPALEEEDERTEESKSDCDSDASFSFKPNIEELEMLLEAYFVQIDGVLQKLSDMSEYVDDTEDYINIMLDDKQNQLLQMGVLLSTANMVLNAGIVVVGIFGMNIEIEIFKDGIGKPRQFWETVAGTVGGMVSLYLIAYGWGKKKRLLAS